MVLPEERSSRPGVPVRVKEHSDMESKNLLNLFIPWLKGLIAVFWYGNIRIVEGRLEAS